MTYDELAEKVRVRWEQEKPEERGTADILEAVCWFIAVHEARAAVETYSLKDWARMIVDGEALAGPMKTREDVEEWLRALDEAYEGDPTGPWEELDDELDAHFGIRHPR